MKVLIVNTSERVGGAAVAANRLMKALNKNGVAAKMLVNNKSTDDVNVVEVPWKWRKKFNFVFERGLIYILNGFTRNRLFEIDPAFTGSDITKLPCFKEADIIHLHWVNQGMLSLRSLRRIFESGKPVVWTMHDQWCATGICHHTADCEGNKKSCGCCPILKYAGRNDLSHRIFEKKNRLYNLSPVQFIACSEWLMNTVKKSSLLERQDIVAIPNPIDTGIFQPLDKSLCRSELNLPLDKKLVLVGAVNVSDKRKGFDYMVESLNRLADDYRIGEQLEVVCMGKGGSFLQSMLKCKVYSFDFVMDAELMVKIYSAVDVFMIPSLFENLPNMIMEAMACGIPCVGFNVGGIPEMIDHKINGYVAEYESVKDLCSGLRFLLLQDADTYRRFSEICRRKVLDFYSEKNVVERMLSLYAVRLEN